MNCTLNGIQDAIDWICIWSLYEFLETSLACFLSVLVVVLSLIKRESDAVELQRGHSGHMLTNMIQKGLICKVLNSLKFWNIEVTTLHDANRAVIICKRHVILDGNSVFSFFRWAWITVLHANFMPIVRCLGHFSTLCVHIGANSTRSYRFNSTSTDKTTDTGSALINDTGWLSDASLHHASLTNSIVVFFYTYHMGGDIQSTIENSRAIINDTFAVFADWFGRFWMMTEQHFTLLNCWRSMGCLANHVTKLRLFNGFNKRWVRSPWVPPWTLLLKVRHCQELATFSASLA